MLFPLKDENPTRRWPVVTLFLIGVNVAVTVWTTTLPEEKQLQVLVEHGFVPARIKQLDDPKLVVEVKVEEEREVRLPGRQAPANAQPPAKVIALPADRTTFPTASVKTLIFLGILTIVDVPALLWLGFWFGGQLLTAVVIGQDLGVAVWAHIGGFVAGAVLMPIFSIGAPPPGGSWEDELAKHFTFPKGDWKQTAMGRRALAPVNPAIDVSRHLLALESLERPFSPQRLFERQAPLVVEVGSGKGLFLSAAAAAEPSVDFLGVEISGRYARFAASRLVAKDISNAKLIHGDAKYLFRELLANGSLEAVHVYFPDPWWKARHKKRRVMSADFLRDIERVLVPKGRLHFWTDVQEYYQTTLELIAGQTRLEGPYPVQEKPADHDLDYRTHFERRMRLHSAPVYRAEFEKA